MPRAAGKCCPVARVLELRWLQTPFEEGGANSPAGQFLCRILKATRENRGSDHQDDRARECNAFGMIVGAEPAPPVGARL